VYLYFQIDGEFFKVVRPKQLIVSLSQELPNGQLNVLVNSTKVTLRRSTLIKL
jgi:hypothetical protein